jgi:hypothetical protein
MTTRVRRDPDGTTYFDDQRFIWFEGAELHFDAVVYAIAREITLTEAEREIEELLAEVLPKVPRRSVVR